tara:strand:+ start:75 stop:548 length:474 start_codon:yes stop_codon:yes gene_type:complete
MSVEGYEAQIKTLLANKDKLTKEKTEDGRSKYAVQMDKLKKRMKADGASFSKALKGVKKQEREGKFDRGAEGKAKNKLRKKMAKGMETIGTAGRHAGSPMDKKIKSNMKKIESGAVSDQVGGTATKVDIAKAATGETVSQRKARKNKMTKAKIAKSR